LPLQVSSDFKEFLKLLNIRNVRYLLVGGHAVSSYGYVRYTGDMDIWISPDPENAIRVIDAVREFGFDVPEARPETLEKPNAMFRMGVPPLRIELMTTLSGVTFEDCYARRRFIDIDGTPVFLIDIEDLRQNKLAAGRFKDLDDLEHLKKMK